VSKRAEAASAALRPCLTSLVRPLDRYLHFGHGMHTCFGAHINALVLPAMMKPILLLDNLGYAGDRPTLDYEGPFPNRMPLAFDVAV
jgi:hypothetical protein